MMTKKSLLMFVLFVGTTVSAQEIKTKTESVLGNNIAYFIKNKLVPKEELVLIKPNEIESVNVVKRDTIVDQKKYTNQIFIVLKSPFKQE